MKITVRVTKKLIEKHWDGLGESCPIHVALERKINCDFSVTDSIIYTPDGSGLRVFLPPIAEDFSTAQALVHTGYEKIETLKPITFTLDIPKRYLRKGVRG